MGFIIKKTTFNPKGGLYFKYTKDDRDGMNRRDHVFTFDIEDAYKFNDFEIAQSYTEHLSVVMGMEFGIIIMEKIEE